MKTKQRIAGIVGGMAAIAFWLLTAAKAFLDWLGRAVIVDDFSDPGGFLARGLVLLFKAPWWVPGLSAALLTLWVMAYVFHAGRPPRSEAKTEEFDAASTPHLPETEEHLVPIHEAIEHVARCIDDSVTKECFLATRNALRQHAMDGKLRLRGRTEIDDPANSTAFSPVETNISQAYWTTSTIGPLAADSAFLDAGHTFPEPVSAWGPKGFYEKKRYTDLRVDWDEITKFWPDQR